MSAKAGFGDDCRILEDNYVKCGTFFGFMKKDTPIKKLKNGRISLPEDTILYHDSNYRKKMAKVGDLKKVKGTQTCQYIQQTVANIPIMCGNKITLVKICMGRARCGVTFPLTISRQRGGRGYESQTHFYTEHVVCKATKQGTCPFATKCALSPVSLTTKYNNKMFDRELNERGYQVIPSSEGESSGSVK